ncbi:aristolochene synthase [Colletotrichum orchidophilum]|uniref:Aristolochene synthase n=1 Tax=Colletotrichum orchidophilum TaxID=1209926 RepID=A0A1G4B498_9PEZI|nr:aristolochene synthase [Colletotrichum orchidophilum]OHE96224.1 aristolochene synthase [Colletotrichum orchidophilum]
MTIPVPRKRVWQNTSSIGSWTLLLPAQRSRDAIDLSEEELASVANIELNYTHHISVIKDVMSWGKEIRVSKEVDTEGSIVSDIVQTLADERGLNYEGAKRIC